MAVHTTDPAHEDRKKRATIALHHVEIHPAEGQGYIVEHHMRDGEGFHSEIKKHVMADHDALMEHLGPLEFPGHEGHGTMGDSNA